MSVGLPVLWLQGCDKTQGWFFLDADLNRNFNNLLATVVPGNTILSLAADDF